MLTKPDTETTQALARIARGRDWEVVEAWLLADREACVQRSFSPDEAQCRQYQGAVLAIDKLLQNTRAAVELATSR